MKSKQVPIGYKLKINYPGNNQEIGYIQTSNIEDLHLYPEIWEPIYFTKLGSEINSILNIYWTDDDYESYFDLNGAIMHLETYISNLLIKSKEHGI